MFTSFMLPLLWFVAQFLVYEPSLYNKILLLEKIVFLQSTFILAVMFSNTCVRLLHNLQSSLVPRLLSEEERAG